MTSPTPPTTANTDAAQLAALLDALAAVIRAWDIEAVNHMSHGRRDLCDLTNEHKGKIQRVLAGTARGEWNAV